MAERMVVLAGESKNPVVVSRSVYRGAERLDVRRYYYKDGELQPTRKGVSMPIASGLAAEVVAALRELLAEGCDG